MKEYIERIKTYPLFENIQCDDLRGMLRCLNAKIDKYKRGEHIINAGDEIKGIGIVIEGNIHIIKEDFFGNSFILTRLESGDTFSEVLACAGIKHSTVSVVSENDTVVLFIDYNRIYKPCLNSCEFHSQLIKNMLNILASKNLVLRDKIIYLTMKSLRHKICNYLLEIRKKTGKTHFKIPYDRNGLSDYLHADRSALSRELGKMRDEGIIDFYKNEFNIIDLDKLKEY